MVWTEKDYSILKKTYASDVRIDFLVEVDRVRERVDLRVVPLDDPFLDERFEGRHIGHLYRALISSTT